MQENDYIVLLHKQLTRQIEPDEQAMLQDWINQSDEHARLADDLRQAWDRSTGYEKTFHPDLDAAFGQLQARIHAEPVSVPLQVLSFRRRLLRVAAAVAVLMVGVWGGIQYFSGALSMPERMVVSSSDVTKEVLLPDGTQVWLRQGASLEYPAAFAANERPVRLHGEAYFKVAHDSSKVFRVEMDQQGSVEVLGTEFNIRQSTAEAAVTVRQGKVRFYPETDKSQGVVLTAGDKAVLHKTARRIVTEKVSTFNELSWQTGGLEFIRTPMKQVISDLEAYYNVKITLQNTNLQLCKYTAPLTNQPLERVLESLSLTYQLQLKKTGAKEYLLTGGNCQ